MLKKMSDYEHKNDELTHEIFVELGKNFITPFDREDIHTLATGLDDIADYIYASTKYIFLYKSPEMKAYSDFSLLIHKACLEIQIAMKNLKGFKNMEQVKEACIKVNSIENIADDLLSNSMVELFETNDAINIIKVSSVLNYLEVVTDKAEDVANTIENIMIKYA
ncbi:putative phosphate transport protein (TIGR00153 family) [Chryseobacterium sp. SORGH_AS909]|nr:putative phosphate transport protein (TIGR00153 family) [Chryseobacterium sp. SORGH_AS_0909]